MASFRQIQANRENAKKSTGPRTAEGKETSRRNALKHGLAGHGVVFPEETAEAIQERKEFHWKAYQPDGPAERWFYDWMCIESTRLDACFHQEIALKDELARRAAESWDDDRDAEVAELAAKLPKQPERVRGQLVQSKHGVLWMIGRWEEVERSLTLHGGWRPELWSHAMDLLGVPSLDRPDAWPGELGPGEPQEESLAMVRREIESLRQRLEDYLDDRDERARCDAEAGIQPDSPELRRLKRYEGQLYRRLRWWESQLRRLQKGNGLAASDDTTPPLPHLDRSPSASPSSPPTEPASDPSPPPSPSPIEPEVASPSETSHVDRPSSGSSVSQSPSDVMRVRFGSESTTWAPSSNRRQRRARAKSARRR